MNEEQEFIKAVRKYVFVGIVKTNKQGNPNQYVAEIRFNGDTKETVYFCSKEKILYGLNQTFEMPCYIAALHAFKGEVWFKGEEKI